jgi:very-short-patch-repair endonuclease
MNFENENNNGTYHIWQTSAKQWNKIKHLAREMRKEPTVAENILWQELRGHKLGKLKFRRQHSIDKFVVDFYCREKKIIIEVDGEIHDFQKEDDLIRQEFLEELGYEVLRFKNEEIINDLDKVFQKIRSFINSF